MLYNLFYVNSTEAKASKMLSSPRWDGRRAMLGCAGLSHTCIQMFPSFASCVTCPSASLNLVTLSLKWGEAFLSRQAVLKVKREKGCQVPGRVCRVAGSQRAVALVAIVISIKTTANALHTPYL